MPAVNIIIPKLEGMLSAISNATGGGKASQALEVWIASAKAIMRLPANATLTDWEFDGVNNVLPNTAAVRTGASTLYGFIIEYDSSRAERSWFAVYENTGQTFDGTAALDNTVLTVFQPPAAGTTLVEEYHGVLFPMGLPMATGLQVTADGRDGTDPVADTFRAWVLYRSA